MPGCSDVRVLGCGGLGAVIQVANRYALKLVADTQAAEDEVAILEILGSTATTVGFYGRLVCGERAALLLELCQRSLHDALQSLPGQRLADAAGLTTQQDVVMMLNCVAQLHCRGVIHQDIKPSNFLLGQDGAIKLCDFNLSRLASDTARINGGTVLYFSPHMLRNVDEGFAADWWALGVTLYQVLHGLHSWPFSSCSLRQLDRLPAEEQLAVVRKAVLKGHLRLRPLSKVPRAARTLIRGLLHPLPQKRWGLLQVLAGDYPGEQAFSAVALRYPQLRMDMERLLTLRRLCRQAPLPGHLALPSHNYGSEDDTGRSPASSCRSLRALSSCLLQRVFSRKCTTPMASETDDVSQRDQLSSVRQPTTATSAAAVTTTATTASPAHSPIVGLKSMTTYCTQTPAASPPLYGRYANITEPSGGWLRQRSVAASACAKVSATRRFLLPRSDAAVRSAAQQAAAVAPRVLLTDDGRLAQVPFMPCEVRTHEVDVEMLQEALAALDLDGAGRRKGASGGAGVAAAADNDGGQVQGVEVLEEMRLMFERRRLTVACSGSGRSGAGDARPRAGAGKSASQTAAETALRPVLANLSGSASMPEQGGAAAAVAAACAQQGPAAGHPLDGRGCCHANSSRGSVEADASGLSRGAVSRMALRGRGLLAAFDAAAEVGGLHGRPSSSTTEDSRSLERPEHPQGTVCGGGSTPDTIARLSGEGYGVTGAGSTCGGQGGRGPPTASARVCPLKRQPDGESQPDSVACTPRKGRNDGLGVVHVKGGAARGVTRFRKAISAGKPDRGRGGPPLKLTRSESGLARTLFEQDSPRLARLASSCSDRGYGGSDGADSLFSLPLSAVVPDATGPAHVSGTSGAPSFKGTLPYSRARTGPPGSCSKAAGSAYRSHVRASFRTRTRTATPRPLAASVDPAAGTGVPPAGHGLPCGWEASELEEDRASWGSGRGEASCYGAGRDSASWRRCCNDGGRSQAPDDMRPGGRSGVPAPSQALTPGAASGATQPAVPPPVEAKSTGVAVTTWSGREDVKPTCVVAGISGAPAPGSGAPKRGVLISGNRCDLRASADHRVQQQEQWPRREGLGVWGAVREVYGIQGPRAWAARAGRMLSKARSASSMPAVQ